jgi:hypothetical protein
MPRRGAEAFLDNGGPLLDVYDGDVERLDGQNWWAMTRAKPQGKEESTAIADFIFSHGNDVQKSVQQYVCYHDGKITGGWLQFGRTTGTKPIDRLHERLCRARIYRPA